MRSLRLHILGLPNAPVTWDDEYSLCGFSAAGGRFCKMMKDLGHHVTFYGAEGSKISCDEFVSIIPDDTRKKLLGKTPYQHARIDYKMPLFRVANENAIREIQARQQHRDFLLTIGGLSQKPVFDACLNLEKRQMLGVEYSIGYVGNFAPCRVFESYAWMHTCYGEQRILNGRFFDDVIPVFFDSTRFEFTAPEDYYLFVGRLIHEKGVGVACQAATAAGVKLKIIGHEGTTKNITGGHEFLGEVDWKTRNEVMSKAKAVFCPTLYLEPFNCVAVEAQLCGTPVITTDWGGFTETVQHGINGFRCRMFKDFVDAIKKVEDLDRWNIRCRAIEKYSMATIKHRYEDYLRRLETLWDKGWETL
jgi:glycosyltransferase involved in cell wall biosynthesis